MPSNITVNPVYEWSDEKNRYELVSYDRSYAAEFIEQSFDPISLFLLASLVLSTIITPAFFVPILVSVGLSAVGRLLQKKPHVASITTADRQVSVRQPIAPWSITYGHVRRGGVITYIETTGTTNEYMHLVITLAGHEVCGINTMYFDGVAVPLDGNGDATGNYAGFVFVEKNLGSPAQAAFPDLVAKSASKWTTAHKQSGRAGVHVRLKYDQNKFPNGIPAITFDIDGKKVYDPRLRNAGGELIVNGDFEYSGATPPVGWTADNATLAYETSTQKSGTRSLKVTATSNFGNARGIEYPCAAGTVGYVRGWMKCISGAGYIQLNFLNSSHAYLGSVQAGTGAASWTFVQASATAPANTAYMQVICQANTSGNVVEFDEVSAYILIDNAALCIADYLTESTFGLGVSTQKATRIQTTGGSSVWKYTYAFQNPLTNGVQYEILATVQNIGANTVQVANAGGQTIDVLAGETKHAYATVNGDGAISGTFIFQATVAANALDFLAFDPIARRTGVEENLIAGHFFEDVAGWNADSGATVLVTQGHIAAVEIDTANLITAANICDERVTLKAGGTEARYTCNGTFESANTTGDVIQSMLTAMNGRLLYTGGIFELFPAAYITPVETVDEDDYADTLKVQTTRSKRELFNGVKGVFISPDDAWQPTDFPSYQSAAYLAQDKNEENWKDVELSFTTSHTTAQRLAKIELERNRRQVLITLPLKLTKLGIKTLDTIQVNHARYGWVNKEFEVQQVVLKMDDTGQGAAIGVKVTAQETDSSVYAWTAATDEQDHPVSPAIGISNPQTVGQVSSVSIVAKTVKNKDGSYALNAHVSWTAPVDVHVLQGGKIHVFYKLSADSTYVHSVTVNGNQVSADIPGITSGVNYDYQIICENNSHVTGAAVTDTGLALSGSVSGMMTYRPTTNPIVATDAGSNVTINIIAFVMRIQGVGDISYNSGSVTALSFSTQYYLYYADATLAGGTVTFHATTTKDDAFLTAGYFYLGSVKTPMNGAPDIPGYSDGGSGAQTGMINRLDMLNVSYTGFPNSYTGITNFNYISDGDDTTYASYSVTGAGSQFGFYMGSAPGIRRAYKSIKLKMDHSIDTNTPNGGNHASFRVQHITGLSSASQDVFIYTSGETFSRRTDSFDLPQDINLAQLFFSVVVGTGLSVELIAGKIYSMWIEAEE